VNNKQIADKLTTELTGNYNYVVSDDEQLFSKNMKISDESYIPVILRLITPFQDPNKYQLTSVYTLAFYVDKRLDKDLFYNDIDSFKSSQVDELIGSDYITKTYQSVRNTEEEYLNKGIEYWVYELEFTWVYSLAIVGSQSTIKIDTVEIPFIECDITHDIAYINNIAHDTALTNYRMSNDIILLIVPLILSNTAISSVYNYSNTNGYNNIVALDINGVSKSLVIKRTNVKYLKTGQLTVMTITLETAYPRVTFTLDGEVIPNTSWRFNGKKEVSPSKRSTSTPDLLRSYPKGKHRTWTVTVVKDDSTLYDKIVADLYGTDLDTTYALVRDGSTYTVHMTDGVEQYTETGDTAIECMLQEYGG